MLLSLGSPSQKQTMKNSVNLYTACPSLCAAKVPRKLKSLWELIAWIPGIVCICTLVAETAWDSRKSCSCRTLCPGHSQGLTDPAAAVREARTRGSGCVTGLPTYGCASRMPPNSLPWLVVVCHIILHNPNPGLWLDPCPHIYPQFYQIYIYRWTHPFNVFWSWLHVHLWLFVILPIKVPCFQTTHPTCPFFVPCWPSPEVARPCCDKTGVKYWKNIGHKYLQNPEQQLFKNLPLVQEKVVLA